MYEKKDQKLEAMKEYGIITIGTILEAAGIYYFMFPNSFCIGGTAGISVILSAYIPEISPSVFVTGLNVILLLIAFFVLGKGTGIKTTYSSILYSTITLLFEHFTPMKTPMTNNLLLELIFAMGISSCGSALLFNNNASSGGTDIVAMILKKFTSMNIGRALFITNVFIVGVAVFTFGTELGLLCVLGLVIKTFAVDTVIESINTYKYFNIITTQADEICNYIMKELKTGATVAEAQGAFSGEKRKIVFTAVTRMQAVNLRQFVRRQDANSLILITNTSEIIGGGFKNTF